jgi:hypothetical protein
VLEFTLPSSCIFFLHFLCSCNIFLHLCLFFAIGSIRQEAQAVKLNCSCTSGFTDCSYLLPFSSSIVSCNSGLFRLQLPSTIFQIQLLAVLQDFSGFNCLLPIFEFNCYLYFRTSQVTIVFYVFSKFNGCFSFRVLFGYQHLLSLSDSPSIKNLAKFIFN